MTENSTRMFPQLFDLMMFGKPLGHVIKLPANENYLFETKLDIMAIQEHHWIDDVIASALEELLFGSCDFRSYYVCSLFITFRIGMKVFVPGFNIGTKPPILTARKELVAFFWPWKLFFFHDLPRPVRWAETNSRNPTPIPLRSPFDEERRVDVHLAYIAGGVCSEFY